MRITPLDARKQEFPKAFRGYDCDEVQAFLNTLADEYANEYGNQDTAANLRSHRHSGSPTDSGNGEPGQYTA